MVTALSNGAPGACTVAVIRSEIVFESRLVDRFEVLFCRPDVLHLLKLLCRRYYVSSCLQTAFLLSGREFLLP